MEPSKSFPQREPAILVPCISFGCAVFHQQMHGACLPRARVCARPSRWPGARQTWPLFSYFGSSSSVTQPGPVPLELEVEPLSTGTGRALLDRIPTEMIVSTDQQNYIKNSQQRQPPRRESTFSTSTPDRRINI